MSLTTIHDLDGYEMDAEIYAEMEYYLRDRTVCCSVCGLIEIAPQHKLQTMGWYLGTREVCPKHYEAECVAQSKKAFEDRLRTNGNNAVRAMREWKLPIIRTPAEKALHND